MAGIGPNQSLGASKYFNQVADATQAQTTMVNAQAYQMKAAAEQQEIMADARTSVSTAINKQGQNMAKANEQMFSGWDQIVAGGGG